ncbi:MAG: nucleotidyl transferase AbiEii/AbiGii toxin family protein [Deltaproteobacteria bacterium]|nr:nucleotidyl transferase AbiEii/AbiGii toxin family protein [Deltaproteobacteria bacterium]
MITLETLEKLARKFQTGVFPNIVREYFQHMFLGELYRFPEAEKLLFKGGTALRVVYGSPRFSEDLDFSLFGVSQNHVKTFVEELFVAVLAKMELVGIKVEVGAKSYATSGGYFGMATFKMSEYPPVSVEINVSTRKGRNRQGEVDNVASDFTPTYTVVHLPQNKLVEEKVFGALRERKKPRDFYDLYFLMRKGMLSPDQKKRLSEMKDKIIKDAIKIDFRGELGAFLPTNQQAIIRDFVRALKAEMNRQTG